MIKLILNAIAWVLGILAFLFLIAGFVYLTAVTDCDGVIVKGMYYDECVKEKLND